MAVRDVGRTALDTWLKVTRYPVDTMVRLLPNGDGGPRTSVALVVERVDANVRDTIGRLLGDDHLRADAGRRRVAADERERAVMLRIEAEQKKREADVPLERRQDSADQQRTQAERASEQRKVETDGRRAERQRKAEQAAAEQEHAVDELARTRLAEAEKEAKKQRLQVLDTQADALDTESDALTAADEAQRLQRAASTAKAARKRTSS